MQREEEGTRDQTSPAELRDSQQRGARGLAPDDTNNLRSSTNKTDRHFKPRKIATVAYKSRQKNKIAPVPILSFPKGRNIFSKSVTHHAQNTFTGTALAIRSPDWDCY